MTLSSEAIREYRASGAAPTKACSAMPNVRVGHNLPTTAPRQRCDSEPQTAATQSETAA